MANIILDKTIISYGMPANIEMNKGTYFVMESLKQIYKAFRITQQTSASYIPQSQGITVRYNSTLINMLRCYVNDNQIGFYKYVKLVITAYNSGKPASTRHSPFYLLHEFESNQHIDLAIICNITDHDILTALKAIHKVRQDTT